MFYVAKCVPPARRFLNHILQLLRDQYQSKYIKLNGKFFKDLKWFKTFLTVFNGKCFYNPTNNVDIVQIDASLEGMGGRYGTYVYKLAIPLHFCNWNIAQLEIINIVVAFKIWGSLWMNKTINLMCDNMSEVECLNSGRSKDTVIACAARNIWLLAAMYNINVKFSHIKGTDNKVADLLSC